VGLPFIALKYFIQPVSLLDSFPSPTNYHSGSSNSLPLLFKPFKIDFSEQNGPEHFFIATHMLKIGNHLIAQIFKSTTNDIRSSLIQQTTVKDSKTK